MSWSNLYSSICDCVKFIQCKELETKENAFFLMTKGVESVAEEGEPQAPNKLILYKLLVPDGRESEWGFSKEKTFQHKE